MKYCKKCGAQLEPDVKFCAACGNPCNADDSHKDLNTVSGKKKTIKTICICFLATAVLCCAGGMFYKITAMKKSVENSRQIKITSIKADNYPQLQIEIKAENFEDELSEDKLSVKENEIYAKDLKLSKEADTKYSISYTSGDSSYNKKTVTIAYDNNGIEKTAEADYTPKEKEQNQTVNSDNNSIVETHDSNEEDVNYAINNYEDAYIRMVNNKDTYYIRNAIDLSGGLLSEFESLIKSYDKQSISEDLIEHKVESMNKINDSQYEVTVYERYDIYYGEEKCEKIIEYRTIYVVNNTADGFKVSAIKNITQLSSHNI